MLTEFREVKKSFLMPSFGGGIDVQRIGFFFDDYDSLTVVVHGFNSEGVRTGMVVPRNRMEELRAREAAEFER